MREIFTSESVTKGHPDKVCDLIADMILDAYLELDKYSRVACEVCAFNRGILIMGEITSTASVDIEKIARDAIMSIGYNDPRYGFSANNCEIIIKVHEQSSDIASSLVQNNTLNAGDQGIMFGFACSETSNFLPLPIVLAHALAKQLENVREDSTLPYLLPDGKTQVSVVYEANKPIEVDTIIISAQHKDEVNLKQLYDDLLKEVVEKVIPKELITQNTKILINPSGRFVIGGPIGDSGLTGRKIIVDTYGGMAHHGGGSFSGKDYTKLDRSASYYARYVAKNLVAANIAEKLEIQVSYAIGKENPISLHVDTFGTNKISKNLILDIIQKFFDFRPSNIIKELNLQTIKYSNTTNYGHFGKNNLPWEQLDKVTVIKEYLKNLNQ